MLEIESGMSRWEKSVQNSQTFDLRMDSLFIFLFKYFFSFSAFAACRLKCPVSLQLQGNSSQKTINYPQKCVPQSGDS